MQNKAKAPRTKQTNNSPAPIAAPPGSKAETPAVTPLAFRVNDFCTRLGVSPSTFWKYAALGKIHTIRIGGRTLVPADEAARILREGVQ